MTVTLTPLSVASSLSVRVLVRMLMPRFLKMASRRGGDFFILDGEDAVHHFDEGDFGAELAVDVGEFHADGAGADDDQFFGDFLEDHGFAAGEDVFAVGLEAGEFAVARAGADEDVFGVERCR